MEICRFGPDYSKYMMIPHKTETPNSHRKMLMKTGTGRFKTDGINSLQYTTKEVVLRPLYTHMLVEL